MTSKKDLIKEANNLADKYEFKKKVVEKILDDLDKETNFSNGKHMQTIPTIQKLMEEMDEIEKRQNVIIEQIKK